MKTKVLAINGVIAALYIAISTLIIPIAFGPIQFRIPEIFNHLIVFNKKILLWNCSRCIYHQLIFGTR